MVIAALAGAGNLSAGPCTITWDSAELGLTEGGVEISMPTDYLDLFCDIAGTAPLDSIAIGGKCEIKMMLAENTLETMNILFPFSDIEVDGTDRALGFGSLAGAHLRDVAKKLVLRPLDYPDGDFDFVFWLSAPKGTPTVAFKKDEQRIFEVTMTTFIDSTRNDNYLFGGCGVQSLLDTVSV